MTVEPRVEDLLASIRKAIDEDDAHPARQAPDAASSSSSTSMSEQGTLMRGAMREMRVAVNPAPAAPRRAAEEIQQVRARVDRNFAEAVNSKPAPRQQPAGHFASIMAGQQSRPSRHEPRPEPPVEDYPPLRETITPAADYEDYQAPRRARPAYVPPRPSMDEESWDQRQYRGALMSAQPTQSAQASFDRLAESLMHRLGGDRTVEDITRELLRGMLRAWLDENLPQLVERLVREEIERVARRGR